MYLLFDWLKFMDSPGSTIKSSLIQNFYAVIFTIDNFIYSAIRYFYSIFVNISHVKLLNSDVMGQLKSRVYLVLSVVTLFIIIYSLLQIIINPDKGLTGEFSISKILFNLVKATILILIVPTLFSFAYRIQSSVLDNNVIGRLVGGVDSNLEDKADEFTLPIFTGFMRVSDDYRDDADVNDAYSIVLKHSTRQHSIKPFEKFLEPDLVVESTGTPLNIYGTSEKQPAIEFDALFATISGGFVCYIMLLYCFDIALRAVKLAFFEAIAPFPILMGIIPKQSKVFTTWLKATLKTFAELFLRIFLMCLVVYLMGQVRNVLSSIQVTGTLQSVTSVFLVLGLIMFLRMAPKLLSEIFGFDQKNASLSLSDRLKASGLTALVGGALGTGSYMYSTAASIHHRQDLNKLQKFGHFLRRGNPVSGLIHGGRLGMQEGWHNGSLKGMGAASNYAVHQEAAKARGAGAIGVRLEMLRDDFGFMSYYDRQKYAVQMERDSEKLAIDRTLREGTEKLNKFKGEQEKKYKFEDKTKAMDRALENEKKMEDLSDAQTEKPTSNTRVRIKKLQSTHDVHEYNSFSTGAGGYGSTQKMNSLDIDRQIQAVKDDYSGGLITKRQYDSFMQYYEGEKKRPLEFEFVLANKSQINREIENVKSLAEAGIIDSDTRNELISYYEDNRRKKLSKQNVTDSKLYSTVFSDKTFEQSSDLFDTDYSAILGRTDDDSKAIKEYAEHECYEVARAKWINGGGSAADFDLKNKEEDFRYKSYLEMKKAFLGSVFDDKKLVDLDDGDVESYIAANLGTAKDQGKINNLLNLYNAYIDYQKLAKDDSVQRFKLDASGKITGDEKCIVTGVDSLFGEDIFKGKDYLDGAKIEVKQKKDENYSEAVTIDIPPQLKGRVGNVKDFDELVRLLSILQDESKSIDEKYNKQLDYIKFLEPSAQASENIRKYKSKFKKNGKN